MESESDREARWGRASFGVANIRPPLGNWVIVRVQSIGRMDVRLRLWVIANRTGAFDGDVFALHDHFDLSRLWVLDAYEVVRTLDQCITRREWTTSEVIRGHVHEVKERLAEVRMPLAKYEPNGMLGKASAGDLFAETAVSPRGGVGWNVGGPRLQLVWREDLGDTTLELFEAIAAARG